MLSSSLWLIAGTLLSNALGASSAACYDYVLVSTRGTGEPQGPSEAFPGMVNQTLAAVPGGSTYNTVYPAGDNGTERIGGADIIRYIDAGLISCPSQKYALLGYSQGATATAIALQHYNDTSSAGYSAIRAALVVGNPAHEPFRVANVDQVGGKSTNIFAGILYITVTHIPQLWYNSTKFLDICYFDDIVCNGITPTSVINLVFGSNHAKYGTTPSVQNVGSQFLIKHLS